MRTSSDASGLKNIATRVEILKYWNSGGTDTQDYRKLEKHDIGDFIYAGVRQVASMYQDLVEGKETATEPTEMSLDLRACYSA